MNELTQEGKKKSRNSKTTAEVPECIVCGLTAEYCMRGLPKNTYCKACAEDYFQMLEYLDKLGQ